MRCSLVLACPVCGRCPRQKPHYQEAVELEYIYVVEQDRSCCGAVPGPRYEHEAGAVEACRSIYQALNQGLSQATGDVVGMMHVCDGLASASVLAQVVDTLERTGADGVYSDLAYVADHRSGRPLRYWRSGHMAPENLACGWTPPLAAFFAKRQAFELLRRDEGTYFGDSPFPDPWRQAFLRMVIGVGARIVYSPRVWVNVPTYSPTNQVLARTIGCQDA